MNWARTWRSRVYTCGIWEESGDDLYRKKGKKRKALGVFRETFSPVRGKLKSKKTDAWVGYIVEGRDYSRFNLVRNGELVFCELSKEVIRALL